MRVDQHAQQGMSELHGSDRWFFALGTMTTRAGDGQIIAEPEHVRSPNKWGGAQRDGGAVTETTTPNTQFRMNVTADLRRISRV